MSYIQQLSNLQNDFSRKLRSVIRVHLKKNGGSIKFDESYIYNKYGWTYYVDEVKLSGNHIMIVDNKRGAYNINYMDADYQASLADALLELA